MDFGDILEQWDEMQKNAAKQKKGAAQVSHKKANAPSAEEKAAAALCGNSNEPRINAQELWMRRYGIVDKDALEERTEARERFKSRKEL